MRGRALPVVLGLLLAGVLPSAAVPEPAGDLLFARADSLLRAGAPDSSLALVAPVVERALAEGDEAVQLVGRLHQAAALALTGQVRAAESAARTALDLAARRGEPARARMASRWLGYALLGQGRADDALAVYQALLADAADAGDLREEAYARTGLAYLALGRGETAAAREDYRRAAPLFGATGEKAMELDALVGLARTLGRDGLYDEMRAVYARVIREGEQAGLQRVVGFALNNLGTYEYQTGDPGLAVSFWQQVLAGRSAAVDPSAAVMPALNLALARMELGAFDEAAAELEALWARCRDAGYGQQEVQVLAQLAAVEQARGNTAAAAATRRAIMGMPAAGQEARVDAALLVAAAVARAGGAEHTLAFCDTVQALMQGGATVQQRAELDIQAAGALAALDRHGEAAVRALRAADAMGTAGFRRTEMAALVEVAAAERALARPDSALVRLRRAQRVWEDLRGVPRDPQWREQRGSLGSAIHLDLADLLLALPADAPAVERTRAAFDALQGYKSRTLLERMLGPDDFTPERVEALQPVSLERIQDEVLRPGELLLDIYVGERRALMFAVTATGCRAVALPAWPALMDPLGLFLDLVAAPPKGGADDAPWRPAARRLGRELLAPVAAELQACSLVTIAADGALARLPFELLVWDRADAQSTPLGAARDVARVPSATLLARLRARPATAAVATGVLVLEDPQGGAALPGAAAEARDLRRRYRGVATVDPGCDAADGAWLAALADRSILHVPTHSETFDQRPWNSRLAVGRGDDGDPCWLLSADVAALPLAVDLAVLSGCSSAGGRALSGEGMLGLTGAFLAAGSGAVVASLWDVDDAATAALMRRFYAGLAEGRTVAGSLAAARRELARDPATAAPRHWAGFVVVGDGNLGAHLQARPPWRAGLAAGTAALAALCGLLAWRSRSRRGVISSSGRSLS